MQAKETHRRGALEPIPVITATLVALVLLYLAGGGQDLDDYHANDRKLLLLGIEGVEKEILQLIHDANQANATTELPHLTRLLASGAWVGVQPEAAGAQVLLDPARTWTTFMTGHSATAHGALESTVLQPGSYDELPVTSLHRQRLALWDVLSYFGVKVAVCGLWATWPAQKVLGQVVSDRFFLEHFDVGPYSSSGRFDIPPTRRTLPSSARRLTFPEELEARLFPALKDVRDPASDELIAKLERTLNEIPETGERRPWKELLNAVRHDRLVKLCMQRMLHSQPDTRFAAVYFDSLEVVSRWFLSSPGSATIKPTVQFVEVIRVLDRHVADLLGVMGDDSSVVLLASHGYQVSSDSNANHDYCLNRLLERIGLLARDERGAIDYSRTRCFDRQITPSNPLRRVEVNFAAERPQGIVHAADPAARRNESIAVRDLLLEIVTDKSWIRPDNNQEVYNLLYSTGSAENVLELGVCPFLRGEVLIQVGDGKQAPFDEIFPPRSFSGAPRVPGQLCFVPSWKDARTSELAAPIGEDMIIPVRVAPTILTLFGLPSIGRDGRDDGDQGIPLDMPQGPVLWFLDRREAQHQSIRKVDSYEIPLSRRASEQEDRDLLRSHLMELGVLPR